MPDLAAANHFKPVLPIRRDQEIRPDHETRRRDHQTFKLDEVRQALTAIGVHA